MLSFTNEDSLKYNYLMANLLSSLLIGSTKVVNYINNKNIWLLFIILFDIQANLNTKLDHIES